MCRTALLALAVCALRVRCARGEKEVVTIVVWDKVRGYVNWLQDWFIKAAAENCNTRCIISERKGEVQSADVVLFHGPTHGQSSPRFPQPPVHRALYLLMSVEQPKYAKILQDKENLDKDFDVIATYSLAPVYPDTDIPNIPLTYYPLNIMSVNAGAVFPPTQPIPSLPLPALDLPPIRSDAAVAAAGREDRIQHGSDCRAFHVQLPQCGGLRTLRVLEGADGADTGKETQPQPDPNLTQPSPNPHPTLP